MKATFLPGSLARLRTFPSIAERTPASPSGVDSFTRSEHDDPGLIPRRAPLVVRENEWRVGDLDDSVLINTSGCGAVKIFVGSSSCIVFHSFGDAESKVVARQIGNYLLRQRPESVRVLCLQPYDISRDVMDSVNEIRELTEQEGIPTSVRAVRLDNLEHERYSAFLQLDLGGSEEQILDRYSDLVVRSRPMSKAERAQKIELFQSLPPSVRTPEFLKRWSGLSLEEAREVADEVARSEQGWAQRLFSRFASREILSGSRSQDVR